MINAKTCVRGEEVMKRFVVLCAIVLVGLAPGVAAEDAEKAGGPDLTIRIEGLTYSEEGGSIRMTAPPGSDFNWQKDGVSLGETSSVLLLSPTVPSDSGNYWVVLEPGAASKSVEAKAPTPSNVVSVQIFPAGSLPVGGMVGAGVLAALSAFFGISTLRKR